MNPPREFKFKVLPEPEGIAVLWDGDFGLPTPGSYHVIEKSYADQLQKELSAYKTIEENLRERLEAKEKEVVNEGFQRITIQECFENVMQERDALEKDRDEWQVHAKNNFDAIPLLKAELEQFKSPKDPFNSRWHEKYYDQIAENEKLRNTNEAALKCYVHQEKEITCLRERIKELENGKTN